MRQSESDIQTAIIEALVYDGWLVLRINQGGMFVGQREDRYVTFARWQALGQPVTGKGISDILAFKAESCPYDSFPSGVLAIEVKAPGKKFNTSEHQQAFLDAIAEHGGIAIVADCLEDVAPYLDSVEVQ